MSLHQSRIAPDVPDIAELFDEFAPRLERIVGREVHAPKPVVEDACQVAWGRLWRDRDRVRSETAFPWLVTTAVREALRLLHSQARVSSLEQALEDSADGSVASHAATAADLCELRLRLAAMTSLSQRQQMLLWLHGFGFSYAEIAARTGSTRRTVERQLLRGKRKLRIVSPE